jgi:hypothetical protein
MKHDYTWCVGYPLGHPATTARINRIFGASPEKPADHEHDAVVRARNEAIYIEHVRASLHGGEA